MEGILFHSLYGVMRVDMTMAASGDSVHCILLRVWALALVCTIVLLLTGGLGVAQAGSGANWTQAPAPDFSARNGHTSVVYNDGTGNKIWVIGGDDGTPIYLNDVWSSSNGIDWTPLLVTNPFPVRKWHTSVVYNDGTGNKIWVIGGIDETGVLAADVWYSTNGVFWTNATALPGAVPSPARYGHSSVVFDGKMWVIGGTDENGVNAFDVWYSVDGKAWTNATDLPGAVPFSGRSGHTSVVYNNGTGNKIWILGGAGDAGNLYEVWYSVDGKAWTDVTAVPGEFPFQKRFGHTSVVFNNGTGEKMWVISGIDGVNLPDVSYNPQPSVESIAPSTLYNLPNTGIIVTGKYFDKDATVKLHQGATDVVATNVIVNSVTKITFDADLAGKATGSWDVVVTNTDGQTGTLTGGLTVNQADPPPKVTSITPTLAFNGGTVSVTVIGTGFASNAKVKLTRDGFSGIPASNVIVISSEKITCDFNLVGIPPGSWDVIVTNPDGQTNNIFQMVGLAVANAANNNPSQGDTSSSYDTRQSTAPASVVEPGVPAAPASAATGVVTAELSINDQGVISQSTELQSADGRASVSIDAGVVALDQNTGAPVSSVSIDTLAPSDMPSVPQDNTVSFAGIAYELGPNGAQFSPAISITFTAPSGQVGQDYTVRSYDHASGTWQDLPTTYDPQTGTITAEVSHFCCFAVFTKIVTTTPAIAATPALTPLIPTKIAPPSPTIATTFLGIILWVVNLMISNPILLAGIVILAVGIVFFVWKQRRDRLYPKP